MFYLLKLITVLVAFCASAKAATNLWEYGSDNSFYDALEPLPDDVDPFLAYQKIFLSTKNETFAWWYMGLSIPLPDGLPQVPGIKSQTIQAWRVQHESATRVRADWTEIIILADFQSGEDISHFYNPTSGLNATVANYYYDGPITYYFEKNGSDISIEMHQPAANVTHTSIRGGLYNGNRVLFRQVEEKIRSGSNLVSTLIAVGDLADVRNCQISRAKADGYYAATFNGNLSSIFGYPNGTEGETHILGNMDKGGVSDPLQYPVLWGKYQAHFPEFFYDGAISPNWTSILTEAGLNP